MAPAAARVADILGEPEILADFPDLEPADIRAASPTRPSSAIWW